MLANNVNHFINFHTFKSLNETTSLVGMWLNKIID